MPSSSLPNKSLGVTTTRSGQSVQPPPHIVKDYIAAVQQCTATLGGAMWRPIGSRKTLMTNDVGVHARVKAFTIGQ